MPRANATTPALTPVLTVRDGLVVGEGAGMLVLEARTRVPGCAHPRELIGFGCNSDGTHITRPEAATMRIAMEQALADARLPASAIGYVNGHGTATEHGDIAETRATHALFGDSVMISSQKSYLGTRWMPAARLNRGSASKCSNTTAMRPR